uniref:Uncharacterized protein n=1 Tax=Ascaris lumbricoides TaxID=6252 RepID=A0A0M3IVN9_ASCLU
MDAHLNIQRTIEREPNNNNRKRLLNDVSSVLIGAGPDSTAPVPAFRAPGHIIPAIKSDPFYVTSVDD